MFYCIWKSVRKRLFFQFFPDQLIQLASGNLTVRLPRYDDERLRGRARCIQDRTLDCKPLVWPSQQQRRLVRQFVAAHTQLRRV
jgi:hypothetical protein